MTREAKLETVMWICIGGLVLTLLCPWCRFSPVLLGSFFGGLCVALGKRLER